MKIYEDKYKKFETDNENIFKKPVKENGSDKHEQISNHTDNAKINTHGDNAQISNSGNAVEIESTGDYVQICNAGNFTQMKISGHGAQVSNSGNDARIICPGNYAIISSSGKFGWVDALGKYSVITCTGSVERFILGEGGRAVIYHEPTARFVEAYVGENSIKANTPYHLNDQGKFEEIGG